VAGGSRGIGAAAGRAPATAATAMGRMGIPEDAARLIAWLCSPHAGWVTGQAILSDGRYVLV
jgi:3-oxoacyl-[acyl-carrier protein] reductase